MSGLNWAYWMSQERYALENPALLEKKVALAQKFWEKRDAEGLCLLLPSTTRLTFLITHHADLQKLGMFEQMLFDTFAHDPCPSRDQWKGLFLRADRQRLLAIGDPLPAGEHFTLYRGTGKGNQLKYRRGMSWTLNPHTAAWFALRFKGVDQFCPAPAVFTLTVPRDKVFFHRREESELAVEIWACGKVERVESLPIAIPAGAKNDALLQLDLTRILQYGQSKFRCGPASVHGPAHWQRVLSEGLSLAEESGADVVVVALFALLHDVCRLDDGGDPDHGKRAAGLIGTMQGDFFKLKPAQMKTLLEACRLHTAGKRSRDVTIGTCWDADRLDLGRVGTTPDSKFMSTAAGRNRLRQPRRN
jgi:uncharacterized protein